MIDITAWMHTFVQKLKECFGDRVWFVGLQGSYARGEATETSDIDTVVILDTLSAVDLQTYTAMLDTMTHREKICGFLSGKEELLHWAPSDLFQFYHDTNPIYGRLDELRTRIDSTAVAAAIKTGVCNIFHGCVHNMLYEKSDEILKGLYKSASFVVQAICFQETGSYIRQQADLAEVVSASDRAVVDTFLHLKKGGDIDFSAMSATLFAWSQMWITKMN